MSKADLAAIANISFDTIEEWEDGKCVGDPPMHTTKCTNQTAGDTYCECLADAANQCAAAHDANWWKFTACMFAHNGSPLSAKGLESDSTFVSTVESCAKELSSYSLAELKACYGGGEGFNFIRTSASRSQKAGAKHPVWIYVAGELVNGDDYQDISKWAEAVKEKLCGAYTGSPKPASCSSVAGIVV